MVTELLAEVQTAAFWLGLVQIIGIDIVLSGDNAILIALAARRLPDAQRRRAVAIGTGVAIALRVGLTVFAALLLALPWVKTVGGLLLLYIAIKLMMPTDEADGEPTPVGDFWAAVRIIIVADFAMSLDNVIGIAAAAHGSLVLLVAGLLISIPLIVFSSQLLMRWMDRFPIIVTLGVALLGWVGGVTLITDPVHADSLSATPWLRPAFGLGGLAAVLFAGTWLRRRHAARQPIELTGRSP